MLLIISHMNLNYILHLCPRPPATGPRTLRPVAPVRPHRTHIRVAILRHLTLSLTASRLSIFGQYALPDLPPAPPTAGPRTLRPRRPVCPGGAGPGIARLHLLRHAGTRQAIAVGPVWSVAASPSRPLPFSACDGAVRPPGPRAPFCKCYSRLVVNCILRCQIVTYDSGSLKMIIPVPSNTVSL